MEVMLMVQKLNKPGSEIELSNLLDHLYSISKIAIENDKRPSIKGLLEIMSSETVILTAIHKLKGNRGSNTPGSDGRNIRDAILERGYKQVVEEIQNAFINYKPTKIRRVWIPKPGKKEKRPLGIPAIKDRVIQECVRLVLEPILEAQFFSHSYGFRPMRGAGMALSRIQTICVRTKYHWVVEGDISKFFDNVNHTILLKRLYGMGIKDRRVLMIIKEMLKTGVMKESHVNEVGTPQGGIISPLLANVYLDVLDQFVSREWEEKQTRNPYTQNGSKYYALKKTKIKPAYFVRYADDWVLITNSKSNAVKWKNRISKYLSEELNLKLSEDKTLITNIRKKPMVFLGFDYKMVTNDGSKYITRTKPENKSLKRKLMGLKDDIRNIRRTTSTEDLIHEINKINAKIRGLINYYQTATYINISLRKYGDDMKYTAYKALKKRLKSRNTDKVYKWVKADQTANLKGIHERYPRVNLPALKYNDMWIGITSLRFCKWEFIPQKNQEETPYSIKGRNLYQKRTSKKPLKLRADELLSVSNSTYINMKTRTDKDTLYNFEYFLNRPYALNRDRGKCRVCGAELGSDIHTHHINPNLPLGEVNRVSNLASLHSKCHQVVHSNKELDNLDQKTRNKILKFREKLEV
jgi:RNA-directed DNA polymerase